MPSLSAPKPGSYVPPSQRARAAGAGGDRMEERRRDDNSVRVSNLSDDVTEADLQVR
jgi:translation initiation factor 3 subunit G